jgi:hypothetical protein
MIDWATWQPSQRATLLFILREEKILLIHKLRGFGAGKINGPGGKIDPAKPRSTPPCRKPSKNSTSCRSERWNAAAFPVSRRLQLALPFLCL